MRFTWVMLVRDYFCNHILCGSLSGQQCLICHNVIYVSMNKDLVVSESKFSNVVVKFISV